MEMRKLIVVIMIVITMAMGMKCTHCASFKDCYTKCFISCIIEPSQTLCNCTSTCFKDCIFSQFPSTDQLHHHRQGSSDNLGFCKLGCAFSTCSDISTRNNPSGDKVDNCVGSCSTRCTGGYSLP